MVKVAVDMSKRTEAERIQVIGQTIMADPKGSSDEPIMVGVIVDNVKVAQRYVEMMAKAFPEVRHVDTKPMGMGTTVCIRFAEPLR